MKVLLLLMLLLASSTLAQICPPAEVLHPCTCSEEGWSGISCSQIWGSFNLKEIFDNASSYVDDDVLFETLTISYTSLKEIGEGAIEHLKFRTIGIHHNPNLEYISPGAFNASRIFTIFLDLGNNQLGNEAPNRSDIFQFVRSFPNLTAVNLEWNNMPSIPDHAFQNLPRLGMIMLSNNRVSRIGSNAFATGGSYLWSVGLNNNSIPSEGIRQDAFSGLPSGLTNVYLENNEMEFMGQAAFQPLLETARQVYVGGVTCGDGQCNTERLYCHERADWICDMEERGWDINRLKGYACKAGAEADVDQLWQYCEGRNNTAH